MTINISDIIELMYQEWKQWKSPNMNFEQWCESATGKTHLAELILNKIGDIGGINHVLNN